MYAVFSVKPENSAKIEEILKDDLVSRQSITIRESSVLGVQGLGTLVLVEGEEKAIRKSEELFKGVGEKVPGEKAASIYDKLKKEEEDVAQGIGLIFG